MDLINVIVVIVIIAGLSLFYNCRLEKLEEEVELRRTKTIQFPDGSKIKANRMNSGSCTTLKANTISSSYVTKNEVNAMINEANGKMLNEIHPGNFKVIINGREIDNPEITKLLVKNPSKYDVHNKTFKYSEAVQFVDKNKGFTKEDIKPMGD